LLQSSDTAGQRTSDNGFGEPDATMQPAPQNIQLMSKHRVLSFKPQLRLEWRVRTARAKQSRPIMPPA
jgi:hypothetical protein